MNGSNLYSLYPSMPDKDNISCMCCAGLKRTQCLLRFPGTLFFPLFDIAMPVFCFPLAFFRHAS